MAKQMAVIGGKEACREAAGHRCDWRTHPQPGQHPDKYFSDRIGVMYYGKLVELASSDELFAHPLHPYTRALLSAIPLPDPIYEKKRVRKIYNPIAEHDYRTDKPSFREVSPNHFVYCNDQEEKNYKEQL